MSYLNYDKFALNSDEEGNTDDTLGDDTDTGSDEGPLVEPDEWEKGGDDYADVEEENEE